MSNNIRLSVVIPAFNEAANLKKGVLDKVYEYLKRQGYKYEVLIVDDGSRDETLSLVEKFIKNKPSFRLVHNTHGGKAITVMTGLLKSRGDVVLFTDMDQATPINQIEKFFPKFHEGFNIVIGSRHGRKGAPLRRKLSAWGFTVLRNVILGLPFTDTQCGFKAFDKEAVREIFPSLIGRWRAAKAAGGAVNAGFDIEVLFLAKKRGFKIAEIPVDWQYVDTERVQFIKDALEALLDMLRIRIGALRGTYG